jgi:hypothetical protein
MPFVPLNPKCWQLPGQLELTNENLFQEKRLEVLCWLDFHFKEVNNRFKKLGL